MPDALRFCPKGVGELAHEGAGAGATIVRRSASYAFLDAPRPLDDAERRELRSHAGVRNDNLNYRARCSALLPEGRVSLLTKTPVQSLSTPRGHAYLRNGKTR
ncbi:hypothetical protein ABFV55_22105 [Pseudomonas syringae]|uniref:hypothetical protein n=1 Tax=Pseudomonas syringae TaxID=317 RepID=UPI0034D986FB